MNRTARKLAAVAASALAASISAGAATAGHGAIVFRATANPDFFGPSEECPLFRAEEPMEAPDGAPVGSFEFCFATFDEPAPGHVDATGTATFRFADGTIQGTLHLVEIPTADNKVVQFDSGAVTGGTGAYAGASGDWHGAGPITFAGDVNQPNLHYVISLR